MEIERKHIEPVGTVTFTAGTSLSSAIDLGKGTAVYGLSWPLMKPNVKIRFTVAESIAGTYRLVRPEGAGDNSSVVGIYNTAGSAAGFAFLPSLGPARFMKVALAPSCTSARTFLVFRKS